MFQTEISKGHNFHTWPIAKKRKSLQFPMITSVLVKFCSVTWKLGSVWTFLPTWQILADCQMVMVCIPPLPNDNCLSPQKHTHTQGYKIYHLVWVKSHVDRLTAAPRMVL